jgi:enamine deaminase RidA (YjgF/YER057c/UK114 family)
MTERQLVSSGSPYEPTVGFSRAVCVGNQVFISGTAPVWPDGSVDPSPLAQARRVYEIALGALAEAGGEPKHVVRTRQFITSRNVEEAASQAHGEIFRDIRPASTMIVVAGLLDERWVIEVELDAVLDV